MMDIAFVNRMAAMTRGGGETWDLAIGDKLAKKDVDITFYVGSPVFSEVTNPIANHQMIKVPTPHLHDISQAIMSTEVCPPVDTAALGLSGLVTEIDLQLFSQGVAQKLRNSDHDLIHINGNPRFARFVPKFDVPVTLTMHGPPVSLFYDYIVPWSSSYRLCSKFDEIIATGVTVADIESQIDDTVYSVNPGVETNQFKMRGENIDWEHPTVLFVGRFIPAKNLTELLTAFRDVRSHHPDAQLVLIGEGKMEMELKNMRESLDLADAVQFPGYVPNAELPKYYRGADVFTLSSVRENCPIVLLEALACGTPVVASDVGYISELLTDGREGILYEQGNSDVLADAICRLLEETELAAEMGQRGSEMVHGMFSWETQADRLYDIFQDVILRTGGDLN
jgi:glycosyltransferase involved in cell wall biosynthesis